MPDSESVVDEPEALGKLEFSYELGFVLFVHGGRERSPFAVFIFGGVEAVHVRHDDDFYRNADDGLVTVWSEGGDGVFAGPGLFSAPAGLLVGGLDVAVVEAVIIARSGLQARYRYAVVSGGLRGLEGLEFVLPGLVFLAFRVPGVAGLPPFPQLYFGLAGSRRAPLQGEFRLAEHRYGPCGIEFCLLGLEICG